MLRTDRFRTRWVLLLAVMAMVTAACSMSDSFSAIGEEIAGEPETTIAQDDTDATDRAAEPADGGEAGADDADELGSGGIETVALASAGRDIIYTAEITVAVNDVGEAGEEAGRAIAGLGGFLFGQSTTGGAEARSVLTFKVAPEDFQEALARLGRIGEVRSQRVSADDVTERIVDLQSQIATSSASVERLRVLLSEADDIETIVALESELLARETELETLRGRLRTLEDQVALATITLTLTEAAANPELAVAVTAYAAHDDGLSCPGQPAATVEQDTEATVCIEVTNVGDTLLDDVEVRDPVLDVETDDLTVVYGDPTRAMEPGESVMFAAETTASRDLRTRTTVTAVPVDEDGDPLDERPAASTVSGFVDAVDPGGIPSFTEGLRASWELLVDLGAVLVLAVGALLPFIWLPVAIVFVVRWWRGRPDDGSAEPEEAPAG